MISGYTHQFLSGCNSRKIEKLFLLENNAKDISHDDKMKGLLNLFKNQAELDFIEYVRSHFIGDEKIEDDILHKILMKSSLSGNVNHVAYIICNFMKGNNDLKSIISKYDFKLVKECYNKKKWHILDFLVDNDVLFDR